MVNIAILGYGTVGGGVYDILDTNAEGIARKVGKKIVVTHVLDLRDFDTHPRKEIFTKNYDDILNDASVSIVVETIGGVEPAYTFTKKALLAGKSVVTSKKELVAAKGAELIKNAKENNVNILFEASVGGGIPVLRPISQCLSANEITEVKGILNGTTNYILNKMIVDCMDFDDALKLAQDMGFAEKNPAADIEGHDACRKICILATLAFGKHVYPNQVTTEGITEISLTDTENANLFNCVIKLIGSTKRLKDGKMTATVRPTLVSRDNMLSGVNGVFNAVMVTGDAVGDVMFYGQGAGKMATASAVVADMIDCAKHIDARKYLDWEDGTDDYVVAADEETRLYVSAKSDDLDALSKKFKEVFGESLKYFKNNFTNELFFITDVGLESELREKANSLNADNIKILHTLF